MKNFLNKIRRKARQSRGFSITELLAATIILLLAAEGMAQGISFASRNYKIQLRNSESRVLFSTLRDTINYELSQIGNNDAGGSEMSYSSSDGGRYTISDFESATFALDGGNITTAFASIDETGKAVDGGGYVALGEVKSDGTFYGKEIASEAIYTYGITARVENFVYVLNTDTPSYFEYLLTVYDEDGNELISDTIQVLPAADFKESNGKLVMYLKR